LLSEARRLSLDLREEAIASGEGSGSRTWKDQETGIVYDLGDGAQFVAYRWPDPHVLEFVDFVDLMSE
jgi:hypothetical protein